MKSSSCLGAATLDGAAASRQAEHQRHQASLGRLAQRQALPQGMSRPQPPFRPRPIVSTDVSYPVSGLHGSRDRRADSDLHSEQLGRCIRNLNGNDPEAVSTEAPRRPAVLPPVEPDGRKWIA